jgi:hypothetical protein
MFIWIYVFEMDIAGTYCVCVSGVSFLRGGLLTQPRDLNPSTPANGAQRTNPTLIQYAFIFICDRVAGSTRAIILACLFVVSSSTDEIFMMTL